MGLYPISYFNFDITVDIDISGSPAVLSSANGILFAFSGKGANAYVTASTQYYNMIVGQLNLDGTLRWMRVFPELQATSDCYSPSLAVGTTNDAYLAFTTNGAIPGYVNGSMFQPSPDSAPPYGDADVVLSRIDLQNLSVSWAVQGAALNGPNNQTVPQVAVDTNYGWVYIVYQSSGNRFPYVVTGKSNILLACFNQVGSLVWITGAQPQTNQVDNLNCAGYNKNPSIVTDNNGSVYIAYEVTAQTPNGAPVENQQIELVKYSTVNLNTPLNPLYVGRFQWTLSSTINLFTKQGQSSMPKLSYCNTVLLLSFLTTGVISCATHSSSGNDIVVAAIRTNQTLLWAIQGLTNTPPQTYYDVYAVSSCLDETGSPYVVAVVKKFGSRDSVFVWKLNQANGTSVLSCIQNQGLYTVYGFALTDGKNAVMPSIPYNFTTISITAIQEKFFLGYATNTPPKSSGVSGFSLTNYVGLKK